MRLRALRRKSGFGSMLSWCEKKTIPSSMCEPPTPWSEKEPIEALPSCGHLVGSAEAPELFAKACEKLITEWLESTNQLSTKLRAVCGR